MTGKLTMTAAQVTRLLYGHFCDSWAVLTEVTAAPPDGGLRWRQTNRRIDVLLVRRSRTVPTAPKKRPAARLREATFFTETELAEMMPVLPVDLPGDGDPHAGMVPDDGGLERLAIEIKVSRADFFADVRNPDKQKPWRELADRHAYAVPAGLVRLDEVPADSGLIEVRAEPARDGLTLLNRVTWSRRAPRVTTVRPLPLPILMDAFYRTARAEARLKGYTGSEGPGDGDVEAMRAELIRLRHRVKLLENQVDRERDQRAYWQKLYAQHEPPPCSTCGKPLRPLGRRRHSKWQRDAYGWEWDHVTETDHDMCAVLRVAAAMRDQDEGKSRGPGGSYHSGLWVSPPEPHGPVAAAA